MGTATNAAISAVYTAISACHAWHCRGGEDIGVGVLYLALAAIYLLAGHRTGAGPEGRGSDA